MPQLRVWASLGKNSSVQDTTARARAVARAISSFILSSSEFKAVSCRACNAVVSDLPWRLRLLGWEGVTSNSAPPSENFTLVVVGYKRLCLPGRSLKTDTILFSEATWRLVLTSLTPEGLELPTSAYHCSLGCLT